MAPVLLKQRWHQSNDGSSDAIEMNTGQSDNSDRKAGLLKWADCDCFCIHEYAGITASACGWRGRIEDAPADPADMKLRCPWCGYVTLLRIPRDRSQQGANQ
jgi:hypothetical protein